MKLQIDTDNKTIRIEETVNLGELFNKLDTLFPNLEWREYSIESTVFNTWINPITVYPSDPIIYPWVTYEEAQGVLGTYNINIT